jgi:hypothetical protein
MTATAFNTTAALQAVVDDFSAKYQERYGYPWRYAGAKVVRSGTTYSLVTPEGIHYFLSTKKVALAHLQSYLETGRGNMAMCRAR